MASHWTDPQPQRWRVWDRSDRHRPRPAHYFRVRLGPRTRLFIHVEVYASRAALRAAARCDGGARRNWSKVVAQCVSFQVRSRSPRRLWPDVAIIRLTTKSRTGDITHEAFHATCRVGGRRRFRSLRLPAFETEYRDVPRVEEAMAQVHERICIGVINGMYNCGLLRD